jgi:hypothetical protein
MKYLIFISLGILILLSSCSSTQRNENTEQTVFDIIISRANKRYSIWKSNRDTSETQTLFYGYEGDHRIVEKYIGDPENSLFILLLEDNKHVFSFGYINEFTFKEVKNSNYCIFPEFC